MNTIQVKPWGKDQGDFVTINEDDFDPEKHELLDAEPKPKKSAKASEPKPDPAP
jgi:hypothetical protein